MAYTQQQTALYVGIDGSKETLAVATYPTLEVEVIPNDAAHCEALADALAQQSVQLVLLEGSGGFEKSIVHALQQAGVPMAIVPPQRARYFAKSLRGNLKTDRVDARVLARFASCYPAPEATEVPAVQASLKELWGASGAVGTGVGGRAETSSGCHASVGTGVAGADDCRGARGGGAD